MKGLFATTLLILLTAATVGGTAPTKQEEATARKLDQFAYPGGKEERKGNTGAIAQLVLFTPDSLEKVAAWYHKAFTIDEAYHSGVADVQWPTGIKVTEAKANQQWALARDEIRSKRDGSGKFIRACTTRQFVVRTPEHTVIVLLNRGEKDEETMIAVVVLGPLGA